MPTRAVNPYNSKSESPFAPGNHDAYLHWRELKLADYPVRAEDLILEIEDPCNLTDNEILAIRQQCSKTNMVIYKCRSEQTNDKNALRRLGEQLGLHRLDPNLLADDDGVTSLQVVDTKRHRGYIPYSNNRLLWHTDGYYNPPDRRIRAFILHCASPAAEGGENALLDPEIAYCLLRDENPDYIRALMLPDAMTIPANTEDQTRTRPAQTGAVFSIEPGTGCLHMRYTARTRSIEWKQDAAVQAAVEYLEEISGSSSAYIFHYRLAAGEGLLANNVLHNRTAFADDDSAGVHRLLYRARFYDRI